MTSTNPKSQTYLECGTKSFSHQILRMLKRICSTNEHASALITFRDSPFMRRYKIGFALVLMSACGLVQSTAQRSANPTPTRTLTFGDRVAYQYAIEEVYWRHRIWPKENPGPKPALDQVVSSKEIQKKVGDYLRKSQRLIDQHQPITREQLQAEMGRMSSHTKQPQVLRELFAALGNDSFVVAECLARPIVLESAVVHWKSENGDSELLANVGDTETAYDLPEVSPSTGCNDIWLSTSTTNAPTGRWWDSAIWTGSEMIVWGGETQTEPYYSNTGGRY